MALCCWLLFSGGRLPFLWWSSGYGQALLTMSVLGLFSTSCSDNSVNAPGVAADLSHINTPSIVTGYLPADGGLGKALKGADIVVIPAGVPRKPGMTRDDLFNVSTLLSSHCNAVLALL